MTERQKRIDETARAIYVSALNATLYTTYGRVDLEQTAREAWELAAILEDARPAEAGDDGAQPYEPNEEARRRGLRVGARAHVEWDNSRGVIIGWDGDGDPVLEAPHGALASYPAEDVELER